MDDETEVVTRVGTDWRIVDIEIFLRCHGQLADEMRLRGFKGAALDHAIVDRLPTRLAVVLDGVTLQ
jgi:hypothetical protein